MALKIVPPPRRVDDRERPLNFLVRRKKRPSHHVVISGQLVTTPLAVTLPFYVAGYSMLAHVALCFLLRRGLAGNRELEGTLMAVPNGRFGSGFDFRLLRLRYSLPWVKVPMEVHSLKPWVRTILTMARVTGIIFPAGILALALGAVLSARA